MRRKSYIKIKFLYLILLVLFGSDVVLFAQGKQIGGVINLYKHVTDIDPLLSGRSVRLADTDGLSVGDTVLLIQMKGAIMHASENTIFGSLYDYSGTPGMHEFLIIQSISSPNVTFTRSIKNAYNAEGVVQLIRAPYYNSANVTSMLTCQPWNNELKTGGVLVFVVGGTLSLSANIDVTGKGFKGGESIVGTGSCTDTGGGALFYSNTSDEAGEKGEGLANYVYLQEGATLPIFPNYARGRGSSFTGGGGGNGRYSGGGGGTGWGDGGRGGNQAPGCPGPAYGSGGFTIRNTDIDIDFNNNIFMGSGGGGSTYNAGVSSFGANGGGIVIIICDTLRGNGNGIIADGDSPNATIPSVSGNAGAGGGGGGGSIALYTQNYASGPTGNITLSAKGGKGGNTTNFYGEGGGGGGGLIITNNATSSTVLKLISGGEPGNVSMGVPSAASGAEGATLDAYIPNLNGFLFNTISSKITGNQVDSTCSNIPFGIITGTTPLYGGTIQWERSFDRITFTPIPGATELQYSPGILSQPTWFRRVVTTTEIDGIAIVITDVSVPIQIIVHQNIKGNIIGDPNTLCYGMNPETLISRATLQDGNGIYNYNWTSSLNSTFTDPLNVSTTQNYTPGPATATTWYRRTVTSGSCVDVSASVEITVVSIENNKILGQDTTLCIGGNPNRFIGATPIGGTNIPNGYAYTWLFSTDNSTWNPVGSGGLTRDYDPPALNQTTWYRRKVTTDICENISDAIKITILQPIDNNILNTPLGICQGFAPAPITGQSPVGGDGVYRYFWEESSDGIMWTTAYGINNDPSGAYQPPVLNNPIMYRRTASSGFGNCCTNISDAIELNIYTLPTSINAGPDTALYSFDRYYQMKASPLYSYETGVWSVVSGSGSFDSDNNSDTRVTNLSSGLNTFKWTVTNGPCINEDIVNVTIKEVFIPNGFSPNNDGINDYFEILGLDLENQYAELSIVNSAGTEVFYTTNKNGKMWSNWDGKTSQGVDLAENSYYYKLILGSKNTDISPYMVKGFIVLKRN